MRPALSTYCKSISCTKRMQEIHEIFYCQNVKIRSRKQIYKIFIQLQVETELSKHRLTHYEYKYLTFQIYSYYTPFFTKIQAFLSKAAIFVDCDHIYVWYFMSTSHSAQCLFFTISNFLSISWVRLCVLRTKYRVCIFSCIFAFVGKYNLLSRFFVQLYEFLPCCHSPSLPIFFLYSPSKTPNSHTLQAA